MSDTPETDKVWKAGIKMSSEESEDFLRQHAERLERERDQARKLAEDESKWAKQYFEERNDARATAKFWQEQYGHANPEHDWEEFDWEKW